MSEQIQARIGDVGRQQVIVGVLVLLVVGAPVAYAASGLFTAGSTFKTDSGLSVQVGQDQSLGGNPFVDARTFDGDGGIVTAESTGDGYLEIKQWGSSSTSAEVANLSLTNTSATINPDSADVDKLTLGGEAGSVSWDNIETGDGAPDFSITNANGLVEVTVHGLTTGENYSVSKTGSFTSGAVPIVTAEGGEATFKLGSGTFELSSIDNEAPSVTNLDPDGGVVSDTVTLAAEIDDDNFVAGNVTVTFRLNGQAVHTETIASAQRMNYTLTASELPGAGQHTWSVTATDALGAESTASSSFGVPGTIKIRNVSNPDEVLPNATAVAYTNDGEINLSANASGVISLDRIPVGENIPLVVSNDGYYERTTVIPTIVQASDAYLLPETNESVVENRFSLNDPTGEFDSDSTVLIERAVNQSGNSSWRVVAGDQFGVEGFTETLAEGQRYRIRIVSGDGDVAQMGKFTAETTQDVPLRPQSPAVDIQDSSVLRYSANVSGGDLTIQYDDPTNATGVLTVYAVSRYDSSDYLLTPQSFYGTNELVLSEPVGDLSDGYVVVLEIQRNGEGSTIRIPIGPDQVSLLPDGLSQVWLQIAGVGLVLLVGGAFSRLNAGVGAITTSLFGGVLWYVGLLSGVATWATVAVAIVFSVIYTMVIQR